VSAFPQVGHRNRSLWSNLSIMPIHSPDILLPSCVAGPGRKMPKPRHDLLPRRASSTTNPPKGLRIEPTLQRPRRCRHARDVPNGGLGVFDAHVVRGVAPTPSESLDQQQLPSKRRGRTSEGDSLTQPALDRPILTVP
jgi:hypothetical protein